MTPHPTSSGRLAAQSAERPRALVMDDDPLFRTLLVSLLKQEYRVTAAADGSDGFYKALECPPDVAVVDIQMPVWDGLRTLKAFRDNPALNQVGLLVLTSDTSQGTALAALAAGADEYLIKTGLSRQELLRKLAQVGQRRRLASAACVPSQTSAENLCETDARLFRAAERERVQEVIDGWE